MAYLLTGAVAYLLTGAVAYLLAGLVAYLQMRHTCKHQEHYCAAYRNRLETTLIQFIKWFIYFIMCRIFL